jgi:glycerol-3-phosphate acyltransferase PlsY
VNTVAALLLSVVIGYLLGSLPFAFWLARARGVDIRKIGTGNPGAANLFRKVSKPLGVLALLLDAGKGALALLVAYWLGLSPSLEILAGVAAIVGHLHSPFLRFRGGAGLATVVGIALAASPISWLAGLAVGLPYIIVKRNTGWGVGAGLIIFITVAALINVEWQVIMGISLICVALVVRAKIVEAFSPSRMTRA